MRVEVDPDRCLGIGNCESLAPKVFEVGDDGTARVLRDPDGADESAAVLRAVQECPNSAIRRIDDTADNT